MSATIDTLVEPILRSPQLQQAFDHLKACVEEEEQKRNRFIEEIREDQKAEFINGEVIIHSPKNMLHNILVKRLLFVMDHFVQSRDLGFVGFEKLLTSFTRNDYEPDICFFNQEKSKDFTNDQMRFPVPDFIIEVFSPSTGKNDRGVKFDDYALHGVKEYWIIDPEAKMVEQYLLKEDRYELKVKTDSGVIHCESIEGFTIPVNAIFDQQEHLHFLKEIFVYEEE